MAIVSIKDIHKSFGSQVVFDNLSLVLHRKEKVGLIGANGSGKTTLIKMITGAESPTIGEVVRKKNLKIAYLPQEPIFAGGKTVVEEMHSEFKVEFNLQKKMLKLADSFHNLSGNELNAAMKEYDRLGVEFELAGGYEIERKISTILAGVGLEENLYHASANALSGGQLSRLGLAKVLLGDADLLLLDEPTNHLDLEATVWLEKFLKNFDGAAVIISHDRFLLDNVVGKIIELDGRNARGYKGNYSNFAATKEIRQLEKQREYEKRAQFMEKTKDFIARNKDQEGMRGTARGRKKRLDRLLKENSDYLEKPAGEQDFKFKFGDVKKRSNLVVRCEGLSKRFDGLLLFEDLNFEIFAGESLGITGANGTGKSMLLKIALKQIEATAGVLRVGENLSLGYLDQQSAELDGEKTVLEEAQSVCGDELTGKVRGRLGGFLFRGDDVFKSVSDLSGGERQRLLLCKLVMAEPQVLILDEPTNHLDIAGREALENALENYNGTIIFVSHDRYFLDKIAKRLLILGADELGRKNLGRFEFFDGSWQKWAGEIEKRAATAARVESKAVKSRTKKNSHKRPVKKTAPELKKFNAWSQEKIEEAIEEAEKVVGQLGERFSDESIYKEPGVLNDLKEQLKEKEGELALLYRVYEHRF